MGLQYVLSIFGMTLSDRPLSSAWRMTLVLFQRRAGGELSGVEQRIGGARSKKH
jgi:hypothetical protein